MRFQLFHISLFFSTLCANVFRAQAARAVQAAASLRASVSAVNSLNQKINKLNKQRAEAGTSSLPPSTFLLPLPGTALYATTLSLCLCCGRFVLHGPKCRGKLRLLRLLLPAKCQKCNNAEQQSAISSRSLWRHCTAQQASLQSPFCRLHKTAWTECAVGKWTAPGFWVRHIGIEISELM